MALGATPLDAEQAFSLSGGIVISAVPRLNVTLDVYQVDIDDRIVVTDNLTATRDPVTRAPSGSNPGFAIATILNNAGFPFVDAARFFVNGVDTRTRGFDFVATYRIPEFAGGRLNLTGGFNYNKTKIREVLAAPGPLADVPGLVLFGRQESLRLVQGQPRDKINLSADFDRGWVGATVRGAVVTVRPSSAAGALVLRAGALALEVPMPRTRVLPCAPGSATVVGDRIRLTCDFQDVPAALAD